jgi:hypothetical protein
LASSTWLTWAFSPLPVLDDAVSRIPRLFPDDVRSVVNSSDSESLPLAHGSRRVRFSAAYPLQDNGSSFIIDARGSFCAPVPAKNVGDANVYAVEECGDGATVCEKCMAWQRSS